MGTLACSLLGERAEPPPSHIVMLTRLPTFTPTPLAPLATPEPAASPTANLPAESTVVAPTPTSPPPQPVTDAQAATPATVVAPPRTSARTQPIANASQPTPATPVAENRDWLFDNLNMVTEEDVLVISGEVVNNTGVSQELDVMGGLFYDERGQVIADDRQMETHWSVDIVSPGGRAPFEVVVDGIQTAADFELSVEAQPVESP